MLYDRAGSFGGIDDEALGTFNPLPINLTCYIIFVLS